MSSSSGRQQEGDFEGGRPPRGRILSRGPSRKAKWYCASCMVFLALLMLLVPFSTLMVYADGPHAPYIRVTMAKLDAIAYRLYREPKNNHTYREPNNNDTKVFVGIFMVKLLIEAHNDNPTPSTVHFSGLELNISLFKQQIVSVQHGAFEVARGHTMPLAVELRADDFWMLDDSAVFFTEAKHERSLPVVLEGQVQTLRKVAGIFNLRQKIRMRCNIEFFFHGLNTSAAPFSCRTDPPHYLYSKA